MLHQNWRKHQLDMTMRMVAELVFRRENVDEVLPEDWQTRGDPLRTELRRLITDGDIGKAENRLFEHLDPAAPQLLWLALEFYHHLNRLDDNTLEQGNFSREEIGEGLTEVLKQYGIEGLPV